MHMITLAADFDENFFSVTHCDKLADNLWPLLFFFALLDGSKSLRDIRSSVAARATCLRCSWILSKAFRNIQSWSSGASNFGRVTARATCRRSRDLLRLRSLLSEYHIRLQVSTGSGVKSRSSRRLRRVRVSLAIPVTCSFLMRITHCPFQIYTRADFQSIVVYIRAAPINFYLYLTCFLFSFFLLCNSGAINKIILGTNCGFDSPIPLLLNCI